MISVLKDLLYGSTIPELSASETLVITIFGCLLVVLAFSYVSLMLYKTLLFICKF